MTEPCYSDCTLATRPKLTALAIVALVLLRLAAGWHFWSEGTKKLARASDGSITLNPEFSAEGFLKQSVGPLAEFFKGKLPDNHQAAKLLATPHQLPEAEAAKLGAWATGYEQRRAKAVADKQPPLPAEFPDDAPYAAWAKQVVADFRQTLDRVLKLPGLDDLQQTAAAKHVEFRERQLAEYLAGEANAIAQWRHELWRLSEWEQSDEAQELPFKEERIAEKRAETAAAGRAWMQQVAGIERGLVDDLKSLADAKDGETLRAAIDSAASDPKLAELRKMNLVVTTLIVAVGLCLLLGLFTRLAALGGIAFLLSVVATQPPWVAGASPVYYQVVEAAALFVLFATAAGRFAGLDFFLHALWRRCCGRKPAAA